MKKSELRKIIREELLSEKRSLNINEKQYDEEKLKDLLEYIWEESASEVEIEDVNGEKIKHITNFGYWYKHNKNNVYNLLKKV